MLAILASLLAGQDLVHRPAGYTDARSWPLVLHAPGEDEKPAAALEGWRAAAAEAGCVVVVPAGSGADALRLALLRAKGAHRIDPLRVLVCGWSKGAETAAEAAATWPELFAACAALLPASAPGAAGDGRKRPPHFVLLGAGDGALKTGRAWASGLVNQGVDVMAREAPGLAHEPPGKEERLGVLRWFEAKALRKASLDEADALTEEGRWLDASLVLFDLLDRPDLERFVRIRLQKVEAAGIVALGSSELAFSNGKYKDAVLRTRDAAAQFAWMPVGERIRRRAAELEKDARVRKALAVED
jgi:pimeloyl-ACP methyl ester carboxylesterase